MIKVKVTVKEVKKNIKPNIIGLIMWVKTYYQFLMTLKLNMLCLLG